MVCLLRFFCLISFFFFYYYLELLDNILCCSVVLFALHRGLYDIICTIASSNARDVNKVHKSASSECKNK